MGYLKTIPAEETCWKAELFTPHVLICFTIVACPAVLYLNESQPHEYWVSIGIALPLQKTKIIYFITIYPHINYEISTTTKAHFLQSRVQSDQW